MALRPTLLALGVVCAALAITASAPAAGKKKKKPASTSASATSSSSSSSSRTDFDRGAASSALSSVDLARCKATNAPRGEGHVTVKFAPAGTAIEASVDRGPMLGTPVAKCIASQFKKATVPAFNGEPVQVGKTFRFE